MSCIDVTVPPVITSGPVLYVAAAALYDADGRVLLSQHMKPDYKGLWEFPGGRIEKDETPEAALVRELKEELLVTTSIGCLAPLGFISHTLPQFHLLLLFYAVRQWQGLNGLPVATAQEGQPLKWLAPRAINARELVPPDVALLPLL